MEPTLGNDAQELQDFSGPEGDWPLKSCGPHKSVSLH